MRSRAGPACTPPLSATYGAISKFQNISGAVSGLFNLLTANLSSFHQRIAPGEQKPMAKRTTITLETTSLLVFRVRTERRAWCPECGAEVEMVVSPITGVAPDPGQHDVEKWLSCMGLHRTQAADGAALICLNSLLAQLQNTKTT
jgi:hypothetical protein